MKKNHSVKQIRRQEIVEATRKIIVNRGFDGLTVRKIAKGVGLTNGALYRHCKNKHAILDLLIDDVEESLISAIHQAEITNAVGLGRLTAVLDAHLSIVERRKGLSFIVMGEILASREPALQKRMYEAIGQYLKAIGHIFEQAGCSEQDAKSFARLFFGILQTEVTLWAMAGFKSTLAINLKGINVFLQGVRASLRRK